MCIGLSIYVCMSQRCWSGEVAEREAHASGKDIFSQCQVSRYRLMYLYVEFVTLSPLPWNFSALTFVSKCKPNATLKRGHLCFLIVLSSQRMKTFILLSPRTWAAIFRICFACNVVICVHKVSSECDCIYRRSTEALYCSSYQRRGCVGQYRALRWIISNEILTENDKYTTPHYDSLNQKIACRFETYACAALCSIFSCIWRLGWLAEPELFQGYI